MSSRYSKKSPEHVIPFQITVTPEAMKQLETRLIQAISLFKRRLNWLTSESRRIFGVIEEKSVCIVLDFKELTEQQLHLYLSAVERVLLEQVSALGRFNLVRYAALAYFVAIAISSTTQ